MKKLLKFIAPVLVLALSIGVVSALSAAKPAPEKKEESQRLISLYVDEVQSEYVTISVKTQGEVRAKTPGLYVVVIGLAQHRLGLVVDELLGERDIVIKSLGRALSGVRGIAGATELGHQRAVLVLDVPGIVEESIGGSNQQGEAA